MKKTSIKGLTLHFMPYSEIAKLDTVERIKKLLKIILDNKVIVLQGKLKPEEETRLPSDTRPWLPGKWCLCHQSGY